MVTTFFKSRERKRVCAGFLVRVRERDRERKKKNQQKRQISSVHS